MKKFQQQKKTTLNCQLCNEMISWIYGKKEFFDVSNIKKYFINQALGGT